MKKKKTVNTGPIPDKEKKRKNSRAIGKRCEREVSNFLTDELGITIKRGLSQTRGAEQCDCEGAERIWFEAKKRKKLAKTIMSFLHQAIRDSEKEGKDRVPVVIMKENNSEWYALLKAKDFLNMIGDEWKKPKD